MTFIECAAMSSLSIIAALPSASRAMAVSIANEAERETLVAECAFVGVLVDKSLPLVELRERRELARYRPGRGRRRSRRVDVDETWPDNAPEPSHTLTAIPRF